MPNRPIIYQVLSFQEPVKIRPKLGETVPCHADMLRYDRAFHHPQDPSLVAFPVFLRSGAGRWPMQVTRGRWASFCLKLNTVMDCNRAVPNEWHVDGAPGIDDLGIHNLNSWITYDHPVGRYTGLVPVTYEEYLKRGEKVRLVGWREA